MGRRLISFYAPGALAQSNQERLNTFLRNKWFADETKVHWTTFAEVKRQLDELAENSILAQKTKDELIVYYDSKRTDFD